MKTFFLCSSLLALFFIASTKRIVAQTGNIGIGTTSPAARLHIVPSSAAALRIDPYGLSPGQTGELRLMELAANGSNYVGLKAPDAIPGSVIWVLPAADGTSGQVLSTNGSGGMQWITPSGGGGGGGDGHCYTCDGF